MTRFLCRKAYYTTQVSHWQRDFLIEHGLINRKSSRVVYNGLEPDIYMRVGKSTSTKREELGLLQGDVGVVLPGYLLPSKGGEIFLDAAKRVGEKCPQTRFYFLGGHFPGTGSEENDTFPKKIRALAEASGLGERVCFLGHCEDVAEILWCMDIAVVPTVSEEAFGRVAVESMLAGLPVVASRSGGLPEVVADGETGYIVPKRDAEALADMLLRLIEDSPLRRQMGEAGRRRALELFEADAKAEEMWQVIQEVVR